MKRNFIAALTLALASVTGAQADPFTGSSHFEFSFFEDSGFYSPSSGPGTFGSGAVSQTFTPMTQQYSVTATGEISPASGLNSFDTNAILNLTDVTISCQAPLIGTSDCGFFGFRATIGLFSNAGFTGDAPVLVTADGSASIEVSDTDISADALYGNADSAGANFNSFTSTFGFIDNVVGTFNQTLIDTTLLASNFPGTPNNLALIVNIYGTLFSGESITLPNSITLTALLNPDMAPIPEPGTFLLLGGGLAGLLWVRRKKS